MGSCLTTAAAGEDHRQLNHSQTISKPGNAPPPPPPGFEEETVKEVLSETHVISTKPPTKLTGDNPQILHPKEKFTSGTGVVRLGENPVEGNASEVSSEMYTYSGSFSAATTTTSLATDLKNGEIGIDEDGEVTQKVNKLPPAKITPRRQPTVSPVERTRRKERGVRPPPPVRRSAVATAGSRNITAAQERYRNVVPSNVVRREPHGRRWRSPSIQGEAPQIRKVQERSPVGKPSNRIPEKVTENEGNVKLKKSNEGGGVPEPVTLPETFESLENPLVSLECFIFL